MGPSGSGKSTLLNMIGALDKPTGGQVLVDGQDLAKIHNVDAFRAKTVGFVFQLHYLLPQCTVLEKNRYCVPVFSPDSHPHCPRKHRNPDDGAGGVECPP